MDNCLGIDLGGTSAKIAVVDSRYSILRETAVTDRRVHVAGRFHREDRAACKLLTAGKKIRQVGVGVAGDIDFNRGIVRDSFNLGWNRVPLKRMLQGKLKCDVIVDNDANAAAWGLYKTQISSSVKNLIAMTLGTGVGGGIILNGHLFGINGQRW